MTASSDPSTHNTSSAPSGMARETGQGRRPRPSHVKTDLEPQPQLAGLPASAASASSSVSPASQHASPTQSIATIGTGATAGSSVQPSPASLEPCFEIEMEELDFSFSAFQLPEPLTRQPDESASQLSRRTSTTSLGQGSLKTPPPTSGLTTEGNKVASVVRRASTVVKNTTTKALGILNRRPSQSQPRSRDTSVGPGVLRRRGSTSNPTTPLDAASPFDTESEDDVPGSTGDLRYRDDGSMSLEFGLIPLVLRQGMPMEKLRIKRGNLKPITLYIDPDAAKIWWDRPHRSPRFIYIDDIAEIRIAEDTRQYRLDANLPDSYESRWFTLKLRLPDKQGDKFVHLIAPTEAACEQWVQALETISKHRQDFAVSLMSLNDKAVQAYWEKEMNRTLGKQHDQDDEHIDFAGVERVCRSLHIHISGEKLRRIFDTVAEMSSSWDDLHSCRGSDFRLDFRGFQEFVKLLKTREDIRRVFQEHTKDPEAGMTKAEFLRFLREVQREDVDAGLADWEAVFARFARRGRSKDVSKQQPAIAAGMTGVGAAGGDICVASDELTMSEAAFASFLTSTSNEVIPKEPQQYVLDRPFNEYYISSSHNTYLLGRQVKGVSSVEGYISALMRGCRCVEVDCWDGPAGEPVVTHGRSMTNSISFEVVIQTINKYAFVKSRFPLWISLEVRCGVTTQAKMAEIMIRIFGEKLVRAPLDPTSDRLPSPSELMERILIKVKKSDESLRNAGERVGRRRGNSMPSPYTRAVQPSDGTGTAPPSPLLSGSMSGTRSNRAINTITEGIVHEAHSCGASECDSDSDRDSVKKPTTKINPILGDLGVYCSGIHFNGFDSPEAKTFNHIFSFKESTFAAKSQPSSAKRALYRHNMRYLMRVYPNATRLNSSNFDPLVYWKRGVQMAALNWQTFDLGMQINQAMFDGGTAASGYVLKPLEGRQIKVMPNLSPDECIGKRPRKKISFEIEIISAQQLMRPSNKKTMDPYVEVEVFLADDKRNKADAAMVMQNSPLRQRTHIERDNGFNPEFRETFRFDVTTKYPDLIFVRWSVKLADRSYSDKNVLATYTAKLSNLKQGYRTIPLLDQNGDRFMFSTLFCRIKKGQFMDVMVDYQEDGPRNSSKFMNIGRTVFSQSTSSPKSSMDSGRA